MRYRMLIEYDGTDFHGWQIQPRKPTVQEAIEQALAVALRRPAGITGSGRTDAGVHARGQVAHFDFDGDLDPFRLKGALNGILPPSIGILDLAPTHDTFHARYDARLRRYRYYISTEKRPLSLTHRWLVRPAPDFDRMNEAARALLGRHDFSTFCRTRSETKNRYCTIQEAVWDEEEHAGNRVFTIEADRFLHGMVRTIVGTLIEIGHGKRTIAELETLVQGKDRTLGGPAAPARGLVLEKVYYTL